MGLVYVKTGRGGGNILNKAIIAVYCLHAVDEQAWVGGEYHLPPTQIVLGDYRQRTCGLTLLPYVVTIQVKEAEQRGQGKGLSRSHVNQAGGEVENQAFNIAGQRTGFKVDNLRELSVFVIDQRVKERLPREACREPQVFQNMVAVAVVISQDQSPAIRDKSVKLFQFPESKVEIGNEDQDCPSRRRGEAGQ